ncbi:MAG TPA: ABC transporter ATP-binding protein [Legionellales bacterium]|jgi:phospholipid/cholesterol/gamma-HCH transport system ATP-binding protein|nr:ABC transporter ATP-binding protein [Legionellales bacterium]
MPQNIIEIKDLDNRFGKQWVHHKLQLDIHKGEILAIIGGSGSGKTTLLRSILMLQEPNSGTIKVFGQNIKNISHQNAQKIRARWGMLFQHSALFSALTVLENIMFPMQELTHLNAEQMADLARLKIALVGLPPHAANMYPAELSGGMQRRAAAARALAMDPELLFLDEPTTGLDPISARQFDELIVLLRKSLNLTIVIISHDIASLERCTDRVAFIGDGRVLAIEPIEQLKKNKNPLIADYFSNV